VQSSIAITNGDIHTLVDDSPHATGLLIVDGHVKKIGDSQEILEQALKDGIPILDAEGATVLPGFIDAHTHLELTSYSNEYWPQVHCPPHRSLAEMKALLF
jgi:predicted amidohydrolase YtcJ